MKVPLCTHDDRLWEATAQPGGALGPEPKKKGGGGEKPEDQAKTPGGNSVEGKGGGDHTNLCLLPCFLGLPKILTYCSSGPRPTRRDKL